MKQPSKNQWKQFFGILNKKEKILFFSFLFVFLISSFYLLRDYYLDNTKIVPASGGSYAEGIVGSPRFINPIYSESSDVDKDLVRLIFAGLMKYNPNGEIVPDLAEDYKILENGKVYEFVLKQNLVWEDGQPLTADDIIFTIEKIQSSDIKSPLRPIWAGVYAEKVSDLTIRFTLRNESVIFLENCTFKIIPKHYWEDVSAANFALSSKNLLPLSSGPYKLKNIKQEKDGAITSIELQKNNNYHRSVYIPNITFNFYQTEEDLLKAYNNNQIDNFSLNSQNFPDSENLIHFTMPRYFAVFLNMEEERIFEDKNVRKALNYGTNKESLLDNFFSQKGGIVHSPILPDLYNLQEPSYIYTYDPEEANSLLEKSGFLISEEGFREKKKTEEPSFTFKGDLSVGSRNSEVTELQKCLARYPEIYPEGTVSGYFGSSTREAVIRFQEKYSDDVLSPFGLTQGTGSVRGKTREKLNEVCFETPEEIIPLSFTLSTIDQPILIEIAEELKNQWKEMGVRVALNILDLSGLERDILRNRDFDALLFGTMLSSIPDPFPFWHSTQNGEMGLNLVNYDNRDVDILLEDNRQFLDQSQRGKALEEFQNILIEDSPAVFLYNPDYLYSVSDKIKGVEPSIIADPSERFYNIGSWYIKTKRVWK